MQLVEPRQDPPASIKDCAIVQDHGAIVTMMAVQLQYKLLYTLVSTVPDKVCLACKHHDGWQ